MSHSYRDDQTLNASANPSFADVLDAPRDAANISSVRARVEALTARFPVYR